MTEIKTETEIRIEPGTGGQWQDAPKAYGPHKALYNCFRHWPGMGIFDHIVSGLTAQDCGEFEERLKAVLARHIGRIRGGLNTRLHAV